LGCQLFRVRNGPFGMRVRLAHQFVVGGCTIVAF
jgi:hypothetical protein